MKPLLLSALLLALGACTAETDAPATGGTEAVIEAPDTAVFGDGVPDGDALSPTALAADPDDYADRTVVVEGEIEEVCQQAGCWLTFVAETGETIRIEVPRDESESYVFTFPKDAAGQTARVAGMLTVRTESVDDLRHYAEDRGASAEALAAITEPRRTLVLEALGAELNDA